MHTVAAATIRSLLEEIAGAIADQAPDQQPRTGTAPGWQAVTDDA
jgi:hypothetical protein